MSSASAASVGQLAGVLEWQAASLFVAKRLSFAGGDSRLESAGHVQPRAQSVILVRSMSSFLPSFLARLGMARALLASLSLVFAKIWVLGRTTLAWPGLTCSVWELSSRHPRWPLPSTHQSHSEEICQKAEPLTRIGYLSAFASRVGSLESGKLWIRDAGRCCIPDARTEAKSQI